MTREDFFEYCLETYGTTPDFPFEDSYYSTVAVFRHVMNRKWYAVAMKVQASKLGLDGDGAIDIINVKIPVEMFGSFGKADGVYPAYHMNKAHWVSVVLERATPDTVAFLTAASYEVTRPKKRKVKREK